MNREQAERVMRMLLTAGRRSAAAEERPGFGFETRLWAAIRARNGSPASAWDLGNRLFWRMVPVAAAVAVCVCAAAWWDGSAGTWDPWADPLALEWSLAGYFGGAP